MQCHDDLIFYTDCEHIYIRSHMLKVEYRGNEYPLKNSEKIAYVGQRLIYLIIKNKLTMFSFS